jgi:16S rRNA (adenine1518-N6/adenine1519-N6)-dimethyltransferase
VSTRSARQRELGQNFLVDRNILDVIERLAGLSADDVVLEVGGGLGILSERLAARARALHVVELDRRLESGLREVLAPYPGAQLHIGDALAADLATLDPAPTKMVANLPYKIAATLLLRTIEALPGLSAWVVMVQREIGERFAAGVGDDAYGVPSVLAQLACHVRVLRPVSRTVFRPVPHVDSVLLGLERFGPAADPHVRAVVRRAFAHRRKALARSLVLDGAFAPDTRDQARARLVELGHPADERAERLTPEEFRQLAGRLAP